jgi:hypothetical protein
VVNKTLLFSGLVLAGVAAALVVRNRLRSPYDRDVVDSSGDGEFGSRSASAPEQRWAPATTRDDVSADELSMASRVETSFPAIQEVWPSISLDELRPAEGDLDRLAGLIAEKVERPRDLVRNRLDAILARETPQPSYPAY